MSTTDPRDPIHSAAQSPNATPEQPTAMSQGSGPRRKVLLLIIGCVVVILVTATVTAWAIMKPELTQEETPPPSPPPSTTESTPEATKTVESSTDVQAGPEIVPFDLTSGREEPKFVWTLGLWSGVAVFELQYEVTKATDSIPTYTSILRAVDVATGKILWTYDMYPDVGAWNGTGAGPAVDAASDGEDLVTVFTMQNSPSLKVFDPAGTQISVISLRTGERSSGFLDQQTGKDASGNPVPWVWGLMDFDKDVLVIESMGSPNDTVPPQTRAYAKDNLKTPMWTISGTKLRDNHLMPLSDRHLPGGYTLTAAGDYVGITDGKPSGMTLISADDSKQSVFSEKDGVILVNTYSTSPIPYGVVELSTLQSTTALDPSTLASKWTYQPPQESGGHFLPNECTAHGNLLYTPYFSDQTPIYSVNMDSGKEIWETSLASTKYDQPCPGFWKQDLPVVALLVGADQSSTGSAVFLDATTGSTISTIPADMVFAAHDGTAVALAYNPDTQITSVSVFSVNPPSATPLWTRNVSLVFRNSAEPGMALNGIPFEMSGKSVIVVREDGQYEFILM